ncbi:hypothetical protein AXG93_815s1570 [Marchantia polymorpha subsp. ruderalis]|uniref:Uncharacterized protein n=1 Tax=Marchantia polymorpha subsp. ruderalis TaxID=1480154 RepID=A0A176W097_MARPO|nr:hypothetical protein AXG93_815s1570 [Marchantia polymorpha subsp. ruderalis]
MPLCGALWVPLVGSHRAAAVFQLPMPLPFPAFVGGVGGLVAALYFLRVSFVRAPENLIILQSPAVFTKIKSSSPSLTGLLLPYTEGSSLSGEPPDVRGFRGSTGYPQSIPGSSGGGGILDPPAQTCRQREKYALFSLRVHGQNFPQSSSMSNVDHLPHPRNTVKIKSPFPTSCQMRLQKRNISGSKSTSRRPKRHPDEARRFEEGEGGGGGKVRGERGGGGVSSNSVRRQ